MRTQYKVLAEKYNLIEKTSFHPSNNAGWLLFPIGKFHDRELQLKPGRFLQWFEQEYCPTLNFDFNQYRDINGIIERLIRDTADAYNIKINWDDGSYGGDDPNFIRVHKMVIEEIYNSYMAYEKSIRDALNKASDKAQVNLDI
jgi:hypothetical protein